MKSTEPAKMTRRQDALLAQVRELSAGVGERGALAADLGIVLPRLSEYLADPPVRRPNGETTLAMLEWVQGRTGKKRKP